MNNSPEIEPNQNEQHEQDQLPTIYAIHDTDPATGEEFWYIKDQQTDERTPIDTQIDEEGRVRQVLEDGQLGAEVIQNATDDPESVRYLYGNITPDQNTAPTAESSLTATAKNEFYKPPETSGTEDMGNNQASNALGLASSDRAIREEVNATSPEGTDTSPESQDDFAEKVTAYHEKLNTSVTRIAGYLANKGDHLKSLGMPDAGDLFNKKADLVSSTIQDEIMSAGDDLAKLSEIHSKYLEGDPSKMLSQIEPMLGADASTSGFNEVLQRTTTIPELMFIADKLVTARAVQKGENLIALENSKDSDEVKRILQDLKDNEATITSEDAANFTPDKTTDAFGFPLPTDGYPEGVDNLGFPKPTNGYPAGTDSLGFPKAA